MRIRDSLYVCVCVEGGVEGGVGEGGMEGGVGEGGMEGGVGEGGGGWRRVG